MRFFISLFFVMIPTLTATSMALACDPITLLTVTIESSDAPECLQVTGLEEGDAAQIQVDNACDVEVTISPLECDDVCSEEETFAPNTGGVMDVRESIGWSTADASGVITTSISEKTSGCGGFFCSATPTSTPASAPIGGLALFAVGLVALVWRPRRRRQ